jgi:hypothetical protein
MDHNCPSSKFSEGDARLQATAAHREYSPWRRRITFSSSTDAGGFAQFQFAEVSATRIVFTQKLWRRARHARTPRIRQ